MTRKDILEAARKCVCGERAQDYGKVEDNFALIAELWTAYLKPALAEEENHIVIEPKDIAAMMALLKIARIATGHAKLDNWVELAGYAICGGEIEGREE